MNTSGLKADGLLTRAKARVETREPPPADAPAAASAPRSRVAEVMDAARAFTAICRDAVEPTELLLFPFSRAVRLTAPANEPRLSVPVAGSITGHPTTTEAVSVIPPGRLRRPRAGCVATSGPSLATKGAPKRQTERSVRTQTDTADPKTKTSDVIVDVEDVTRKERAVPSPSGRAAIEPAPISEPPGPA